MRSAREQLPLPETRRRRFLLAQVTLWSVYACVRLAAAIPAIPDDARGIMAFADTIHAATGFLITSGCWFLARRFIDPVTVGGWAFSAVGAVGASFLWMVVDRAVLVTAASVLGIGIPWELFIHGVDLTYGLVLLAWTGGALAFLLVQREAQARESLLAQQLAAHEAQVRALSARLNPHFLFNTLNTIRSLTAEDHERSREMLTRLSAFLRHALSIDVAVPTTLSAEMESVRAYLWIEEARFEPDLEVRIDVAPDALSASIPPLILQPLVENAVMHGDAAQGGVRHVRVRADRTAAGLRVEVANTGTLAAGERGEGVGTTLTRTRLRQMYGSSQRFTLRSADGWVFAEIEIGA